MKKHLFIGIAALMTLGACGDVATDADQPDFAKLRAAGGKADGWFDPNLSCSGSCGALATGLTGYCGCDDLCATYGDCCTDKAQICDGGTNPDPQKCQAIDADYAKAVTAAGGCNTDADCSTLVAGNLACHLGRDAINPMLSAPVDAIKQKWQDNKCNEYPWVCPMVMPLPPWIELHGVCEQGSCAIKQVDTRAAKEGDQCGDDINVQCGEGLYCAMGLNWCGTPPVTGICRKHGDCGAPSDCLNNANNWVHPMCLGQATCDNNSKCGWDCSNPPSPPL